MLLLYMAEGRLLIGEIRGAAYSNILVVFWWQFMQRCGRELKLVTAVHLHSVFVLFPQPFLSPVGNCTELWLFQGI